MCVNTIQYLGTKPGQLLGIARGVRTGALAWMDNRCTSGWLQPYIQCCRNCNEQNKHQDVSVLFVRHWTIAQNLYLLAGNAHGCIRYICIFSEIHTTASRTGSTIACSKPIPLTTNSLDTTIGEEPAEVFFAIAITFDLSPQ